MSFNFYGVFVSLGIFMGFWVAERLNKRYQLIQKFSFWDSLLWLIVPGVVGARAYHVIDYWQYYSQNPGEIIKIWHGGVGIFGAMIGGLIGLIFFILKLPRKLSLKKLKTFFKILDLGVIGLSLGQSIGRWGNFFNQELLFVALWESLGDFLIFVILFLFLKSRNLTKEKYQPGQTLFLYLILYGLIRFGLEFMRTDPWLMGKVISILMIITGLAGLSKKR